MNYIQRKIFSDYRFWTAAVCAVFFTVLCVFNLLKMSIPTEKSYGAASCVFIYIATFIPFAVIFLCAVIFKVRGRTLLFIGILLLVSYFIRILYADFVSKDYFYFLGPWTETYRNLTIEECFKNQVGNYPPLYNYFLILFSRIPLKDMYLIKVFSLCGEIIMYLLATKLVAFIRKEKFSFLLLASLTLIPTFLLNSSQWSQCDCFYTACAVGAVYLALKRKSAACFAVLGLGLAFKMQILLIFPAILVFLLSKNGDGKKYLLWRWIWVLPLVFVAASSLPVFFGGSFFKVFKVYFNQIAEGNSGALNLHCANILLPFSEIKKGSAAFYALFVLFTLITAFADIFIIVHTNRKSGGVTDGEKLLLLCLILSFCSVYFMPKMQDRFFHIPEIFAFIYLAVKRDKNAFTVAALIETAQWSVYMKALLRLPIAYVFSPIFTSFALFLIFVRAFKYFPFKKSEKLVRIFDNEPYGKAGQQDSEEVTSTE